MAGRDARAARHRFMRAGAALLALLCLGGFALMPSSSAAFTAIAGGPASSFTARATFGLSQTAGCFSDNGTGGCTTAAGITDDTSVVVSPDGKHVYVGSVAKGAVSAYTRNATTGALTQLTSPTGCYSNASVPGCTTVLGVMGALFDLTVSPDGKHLYAVGYSTHTIAAFSRNATTGALTPLASPNKCLYDNSLSSPPSGCASAYKIMGADGIAISPDGAYVYVVSVQSNSLTVFSRNATTGVLTQLSGTAGCYTNSTTSGCTTASGLGSPFAVRTSPDGTSVYVASNLSNAVAVFQRNMTTGVLSQPAPPNSCVYNNGSTAIPNCTAVRGLSGAYNVGIAPDGATVYAVGNAGNAVASFTRNTTTGVLTQVAAPNACIYHNSSTAITGCTAARAISSPTSITFSPDGMFAFVAASVSQGVAVFRHNSSTGVLTQLSTTSGCIALSSTTGCTTGVGLGTATGIAVSPDGRDVYAVGGGGSRGYIAVLNFTH
ncbi:hypothetical protein AB0J80_31070 [Actinoplanes sp. NPDC049548]|uniref:lactonase family protein n=1 Tax=Actinoplanes sp. NPDC049548 TaxID=3155152 RepID=UPI0034435AD3